MSKSCVILKKMLSLLSCILLQKILPTFCKLNEIEINEVWNSANPLFKWCFQFVVTRNFATMAMWQNDFSSLLSWEGPAFLNLFLVAAMISVV